MSRATSNFKSNLKTCLRRPFARLGLSILVVAAIALFSNSAAISSQGDLLTDVQALVGLGARVAGTATAEKASQYLVNAYRKAGYETEIQTLTYPKFRDLGSTLAVDDRPLDGWVYHGTIAGQVTGRLVAIPNDGQPQDYAGTAVKGAIAIARRGGMTFSEKVKYAAEAGAIAIIIVNNEPKNVRGSLTSSPAIPVLGLSGAEGEPLMARARTASLTAKLNVNTQKNALARNVIAHLPGVNQPSLIVGGHYDSVVGSPGANDNASGTAVVLAIARQLSGSPLAQQLWFIAFDGEEDGLKGSQAFVERSSPQFLAKLKGMVNFDMVGVNDALQGEGSLSLKPFTTVDETMMKNPALRLGSSDHAPFKSQNVPTLFFNRGYEPNYHTPNDTAIVPRLLRETQETALKAIAQILKQ
ncbi:M28 family metallopeptidase [Myxacorys almedinensis]|uniref:M28 family peptidase n=1 Tax=Myxacorys almedinensis A TaxID=2690445 RepID=A0A8J8CMS2_9CYAN|nr:M28 family metallopeptidase [Myxacorys almedinensis]NDJ17642.1 M28 family peptidase [Myxacorys almedinensis A]